MPCHATPCPQLKPQQRAPLATCQRPRLPDRHASARKETSRGLIGAVHQCSSCPVKHAPDSTPDMEARRRQHVREDPSVGRYFGNADARAGDCVCQAALGVASPPPGQGPALAIFNIWAFLVVATFVAISHWRRGCQVQQNEPLPDAKVGLQLLIRPREHRSGCWDLCPPAHLIYID